VHAIARQTTRAEWGAAGKGLGEGGVVSDLCCCLLLLQDPGLYMFSPAHIGPSNACPRDAPETTPLWRLFLIKLSLSLSLCKSCQCAREVFGLWRVCFPPCLVRPGRRLPVQGLGKGSLGYLDRLPAERGPGTGLKLCHQGYQKSKRNLVQPVSADMRFRIQESGIRGCRSWSLLYCGIAKQT